MGFGDFVDVNAWAHFLEELAELSQTYVYTLDRSGTIVCQAGKQTTFFHLIAQTDEYIMWRSELGQIVKDIDVVCDPVGFTNIVWTLKDEKHAVFGYCVISSLIVDSAALICGEDISPIYSGDSFVFVDRQKVQDYLQIIGTFRHLVLPPFLERKKRDNELDCLHVVSDYLSNVVGIINDGAFISTSLSFFVQSLHLSNCAVLFSGQLHRYITNEKNDAVYRKIEVIAEQYCKEKNSFLVVDGVGSNYLFSLIPSVRILPQSLIAVPLSKGMGFFYSEQSILDKLALIVQLSQKFDRAFSTVLHYKSTEYVATTDSLTGVFNRAYFTTILKKTLAEAHGEKKITSLAMFDVDDFKKYNDTFGHDEGDRILRDIVSAIKGGLSHEDVFARYGGEEFVVLFSENDADIAYGEAQELCRLVQAKTGVTVSIGLAVSPESKASPENLIKTADSALYRAKNEGKNRVVRVVLDEEDDGDVKLDSIG